MTMKFYDIVKQVPLPKRPHASVHEPSYRLQFPTICICHKCEQPVSLSGYPDADPMLVFAVALAQWTQDMAPRYGNWPPRGPCRCAEKEEELAKDFKALPLGADTGWCLDETRSNVRRGYQVYERTITFKCELGSSQRSICLEYLRMKRPGRDLTERKLGETTYRYTSTMDSGD